MINDWHARLEALLETVQKPARYTGGEMNAAEKGACDVRFAFCFPDTYEVAMSHLGMKILYDILNKLPYAACERVCMPWVDMADGMRREDIPLFSLETRKPVREFDVVGFTLQYEMSYTNILDMLDLAGIPMLAKERGEGAPLIVAGGPCAFNPEPLADFIDAFMIGDGEDVIAELCDTVRAWKQSGAPKEALLRTLAGIEGVYVPSLYEATYNEDGTLAAFTPLDGAPNTVRKRIVDDLNSAPYPDKIPVPYTEIVHDRIMLEIMRGCTRGCRFCQAGMLYRPVRERGKDKLLALAEALESATGYEEISLSSLSCGDYSDLPGLIGALMDRFSQARVSVSLPSMRIDNIMKQSLEETQKVKKSGLTLAPEAGTQRLRDVINKNVTRDDLLRAVSDAFESGWSAVKLYFMTGLPTETDEDLAGIGELAREVIARYFAVPKEKRAKGLRVTVSVSVFVPKAFTPFQWAAQDTIAVMKEKQQKLRAILNIKGVTFNWHDPELSMLEACLARGDRRIGKVLLSAWQKGARLDGWTEQFKYAAWLEAFSENGLDPAFYANRERAQGELLPWAFIDAGVTQAYLMKERERALRGETTPDCRGDCQGCGLARMTEVCKP